VAASQVGSRPDLQDAKAGCFVRPGDVFVRTNNDTIESNDTPDIPTPLFVFLWTLPGQKIHRSIERLCSGASQVQLEMRYRWLPVVVTEFE
jgi:hypothetical protein